MKFWLHETSFQPFELSCDPATSPENRSSFDLIEDYTFFDVVFSQHQQLAWNSFSHQVKSSHAPTISFQQKSVQSGK